MDQSQRKYAMERVKELLQEKTTALRKKHLKASKPLTPEQKLQMIYNGTVDMVTRRKWTSTMLFIDAYDFKGLNGELVLDEKAFEKESIPLHRKAAAIRDQIMLGDTDTAIKLLEEFAKEK